MSRSNFGKRLIAVCMLGGFVAEFNAGLNAVKERGRDGEKAVTCAAVGDGTNMGVDAEDFLDDDEAGDRPRQDCRRRHRDG